MYLPAHFEESRADVLCRFVADHPLATLVTLGPAGLTANHLPLEHDTDPRPFGTLRGHVARANPLWRDAHESEVMVIFHGPGAYVSPSFYPTKRQTGRVVPTWNYAVVHAHGRLRAIEDRAWLRSLVERLTTRHEQGRQMPWQVADAPEEYVRGQLGAIVGLEIVVSRLVGKWKMSQNRGSADRAGVVEGLRLVGSVETDRVADLVEGASTDPT